MTAASGPELGEAIGSACAGGLEPAHHRPCTAAAGAWSRGALGALVITASHNPPMAGPEDQGSIRRFGGGDFKRGFRARLEAGGSRAGARRAPLRWLDELLSGLAPPGRTSATCWRAHAAWGLQVSRSDAWLAAAACRLLAAVRMICGAVRRSGEIRSQGHFRRPSPEAASAISGADRSGAAPPRGGRPAVGIVLDGETGPHRPHLMNQGRN